MKAWKCGTSKANQEIKRVYGLKGKEPWMPTIIEFSDLNLGCLDAPELLPAGSTWRDEEPEIDRFTCNETLTYRSGPVPWKQGAEKFNRNKGDAK